MQQMPVLGLIWAFFYPVKIDRISVKTFMTWHHKSALNCLTILILAHKIDQGDGSGADTTWKRQQTFESGRAISAPGHDSPYFIAPHAERRGIIWASLVCTQDCVQLNRSRCLTGKWQPVWGPDWIWSQALWGHLKRESCRGHQAATVSLTHAHSSLSPFRFFFLPRSWDSILTNIRDKVKASSGFT